MTGSPGLNVCVVVPYDLKEEGGVKRNAMHVASALARRGDRVTVIGPVSGAPPTRASRRQADGHDAVEVYGFGGVLNIRGNGSDNRLGLLTSPLALRRFFRERAFDVVHVHEPLLPALPYWAVWSSPAAAHVATFHGYAEDEGAPMRVGRRLSAALLLRGFERGIAVSRPAARFAEVAWRRELSLITNGVPTGIYRPGSEAEVDADADAAERAPGEPLRLLFVGHFRDRRKGLPYLVQALELLRARGVAATLDVVGSGDRESLPHSPGVTFHGPVSDETVLAEHYRRCDLFAATATGQESFGIVLLEAMAAGKPVVCSDIDGYREVVGEDGARFVPPANVPALADALAELAADASARRRMGRANLLRAETFDWERIAVAVRDQYLLALADRGARPFARGSASESGVAVAQRSP